MIFTWLLGIYYFGNVGNTTSNNSKETKKAIVIGPQYIYFFMDTSMGIITTYCMVGLLFAMMIICILFSLIIEILDTNSNGSGSGSGSSDNNDTIESDEDNSLIVNIIFFLVGILLICRFRDYIEKKTI
jgi:preprotein translocase subunit SecG